MMTNTQRALLEYIKKAAQKGRGVACEMAMNDREMARVQGACIDFFQKIEDDVERIENIENDWP